jgi:hypothetical protein
MKKFAALALASVVLASTLQAQSSQPQGQQVRQQALGPNAFVIFAVQAVNNLDQGRAGLVYDRSSAGFKASTTRDRFVADVARKREQIGKIVNRQWSSVSRSTISANGRQQPLVVVTLVATSDKRQAYNEIVQFTLEPDNTWHLANYTF